MMKQYLSDTNLNEFLINKGYVIIDFFNKVEVEHLLKLNKNVSKFIPNKGLNFSFVDANEKKLEAAELYIKVNLRDNILKHFNNLTLFGTGFINKRFGFNNQVTFHQDWNLVDETQYNSIACWIALQDTDINSGTIAVIPKSHTIKQSIRTINSPSLTINLFEKQIKKKVLVLTLKAGQGIAYFPNLFHATYPNKKYFFRRAIALNLIPITAQALLFEKNEEKNLFEAYILPSDFSFKFKHYIIDKNYKLLPKVDKTFDNVVSLSNQQLFQQILDLQ